MASEDIMTVLNNLDPENIGTWPIWVRGAIWIVVFAVTATGFFQFKVSESLMLLEEEQKKEAEHIEDFQKKSFKASILPQLKEQMTQMQFTFNTLLKQLPSETEVPGLLDDISQQGIESGLEFELIKPNEERIVEFYAELPIDIRVKGSYHALSTFISGVASLPRIVTLHDFSVDPEGGKEDFLTLSITAKTYRYNSVSGGQ